MSVEDRALLEPQDASSLRQARVGGARQETARDSLHYYEDYGLTMNEDSYKRAKEAEAGYEENVGRAREAIASGYSELDRQYEVGLSQFPEIPSWESYREENLRQVRIMDRHGTTIEQTYWLPPEAIASITSEEDFSANYPYAVFEDGSMNIIPYIGHEARGAELHEALGEAQASIMMRFNAEIEAAGREIGAARGALDLEYQTARDSVAQQEGFVNESVAQQQEYKSMMKRRYSEKLADMRETIMSMFGGGN